MTGRRRDKGKPIGVIATTQNSYAHFQWRLRKSSKPGHQIHAVAVYLQAVVTRADPSAAARIAAEVVADWLTKAHRIEEVTVADARTRRERER